MYGFAPLWLVAAGLFSFGGGVRFRRDPVDRLKNIPRLRAPTVVLVGC